MVDGIGTAKLENAVAAGREVRPELEGDMQGEINNLQGKAGELVASLSQDPVSNNGGRIVKTLEEGETDTIATT
ncbi:MAG: hypothetical protein VKK32_04460 [Candidatus Melainabacteria bacterium]|nr:hypothetical protein [Candidatus Melainabacteria bacterium]